MGYRAEILAPGNIYHVYNRGVDKTTIFRDDLDRGRFIDGLIYYLPQQQPGSFTLQVRKIKRADRRRKILKSKPEHGKGLVDLLNYCLMDNHMHLVLRENTAAGITIYLQQLLTSYVKYFNTRHGREGPLFRGRFRAVRVSGDEHFLQVMRYVHLNPFIARMVDDPIKYRWSSLTDYLGPVKATTRVCHTALLRSMMRPAEYRAFVEDYADYARTLKEIEELTLE